MAQCLLDGATDIPSVVLFSNRLTNAAARRAKCARSVPASAFLFPQRDGEANYRVVRLVLRSGLENRDRIEGLGIES